MKTYIALLKGINVGGKNSLKMQDLKSSLQALPLYHLNTYIQSGNLVFKSSETSTLKLERALQHHIETTYALAIPVLVFTLETWKKCVLETPFQNLDNALKSTYITFWSAQTKRIDIPLLDSKKQTTEAYEIKEQCLYLYTPDGYSQTKITQHFIEKLVGTSTSTRNLNSCLKIYELALTLPKK